jgi:hypothetical protein
MALVMIDNVLHEEKAQYRPAVHPSTRIGSGMQLRRLLLQTLKKEL